MVPFIVDPAGRCFRCGTGGPALPGLYFPGGRLERGLNSVAVVRGAGRSGLDRLEGRARCPSWSSLSSGSRARGGHVEDARDSTSTVQFLNGVPAAWWMDVPYILSFWEAGLYAHLCIISAEWERNPWRWRRFPAGLNWNRVWCIYFWKYAVFSDLFVGGGFGSSLTVGIKACRRRCSSEELARGRPGARWSAPPDRCGWSRARGLSRPPRPRPPADCRRRVGPGPGDFKQHFPLYSWNSEILDEAGVQMGLIMCRVPCFL